MASDYARPRELDEAVALLSEHGFDANVLAGGQSLVPMMSAGLLAPELLIDINRIVGLDRLEVDDDRVHIGPLVRHRQLEHAEPVLRERAPLLPPAAGFIAHAAIRNRGTFVGSIVHADPSAEWPAVALALDARIRLVGSDGEREVPAAEFFEGPLTSAIEPEELAVEVSFPTAPPATGASVQELAYRDGDYAIVGVATQISLTADGTRVTDVRIGLFGVDSRPVRATEAEQIAAAAGREGFGEAAQAARTAANPMSDATASAQYRSAMIPVMCRRAVMEAHARARAAAGITG